MLLVVVPVAVMTLLLVLIWVLVATMMTVVCLGMRRHLCRSTFQVDVNPARVFLRCILETEFAADLFDPRLDLLDMANGMFAFANDAGASNQVSKGWIGRVSRHFT